MAAQTSNYQNSLIKSKKAVINMENEDEECFKWVVTRVLYPVFSNPK